jgi:hypothetical protein
MPRFIAGVDRRAQAACFFAKSARFGLLLPTGGCGIDAGPVSIFIASGILLMSISGFGMGGGAGAAATIGGGAVPAMRAPSVGRSRLRGEVIARRLRVQA